MQFRKSGGAARDAVLTACLLTLSASTLFAQVRATYLYTLSNFSGRLPYDWVRVKVDPDHEETYVIYQDVVRIFSGSGMEVFSFGDDLGLGHILDAVVDSSGDIFLLSYKDSHSIVTRCNFRGLPIGPFEIKGLPAGLVFGANRMVLRGGLFYFVSQSSSSLIVTDASGEFKKHVDLLSLVATEDENQKSGAEMDGFTVDQDGTVFFTVPTLFKVYRVSPDGVVTSFGKSGSAPGRFGVIAGITVDRRGNLLVADKLKCVVMMFDKDFNFVTEFGYRGAKPQNLIVPDDVAVDQKDRVYVSQGRRRGVSVFALAGNP